MAVFEVELTKIHPLLRETKSQNPKQAELKKLDYVGSHLPEHTPQQAKVIPLEDKIIVASARGGTSRSQPQLHPDHTVLPLTVDSMALYEAIASHLYRWEAVTTLPGPSYAETYSWLKQPDLVADVDVLEHSDTVEIRFPVHPMRDSQTGTPVFARETFRKTDSTSLMCGRLMQMLKARRHLLTLADAPKYRAGDGSAGGSEKIDWSKPVDPRKL